MWESQTEKLGKGKVAILKDLGVLDVGRWIGGRVGRCGGREGLRELATWPVASPAGSPPLG